jgi:GMP synthase-like glutamine amidotransferase
MKILVVNNHTQHLDHLSTALAGNDLEFVMYQPGAEFNWEDKDLIVLSGGGGEGLEINDATPSGKLWYHDEMEFILSCDKPILGICMGFEVIARAYGSKVEEMKELIMGFRKLSTTTKGNSHFSREKLKQYEAHQWRVADIDTRQFNVLAESRTGIEIIKHKTRPIMATQFHPEKGGSLKVASLLNTFAI